MEPKRKQMCSGWRRMSSENLFVTGNVVYDTFAPTFSRAAKAKSENPELKVSNIINHGFICFQYFCYAYLLG